MSRYLCERIAAQPNIEVLSKPRWPSSRAMDGALENDPLAEPRDGRANAPRRSGTCSS